MYIFPPTFLHMIVFSFPFKFLFIFYSYFFSFFFGLVLQTIPFSVPFRITLASRVFVVCLVSDLVIIQSLSLLSARSPPKELGSLYKCSCLLWPLTSAASSLNSRSCILYCAPSPFPFPPLIRLRSFTGERWRFSISFRLYGNCLKKRNKIMLSLSGFPLSPLALSKGKDSSLYLLHLNINKKKKKKFSL